jgi:hypothetical protein
MPSKFRFPTNSEFTLHHDIHLKRKKIRHLRHMGEKRHASDAHTPQSAFMRADDDVHPQFQLRKSPGPSEGRGSITHARKPIEKASAGTGVGLRGSLV